MRELELLSHDELKALLELYNTPGWKIFERLLDQRLKSLGDMALTSRPNPNSSFEHEQGRWAGQAELLGIIKSNTKMIPDIIRAKETIAKSNSLGIQ